MLLDAIWVIDCIGGMLCIFIYINLLSLSLKIHPVFNIRSPISHLDAVLQMLTTSPYVHFSRSTVEVKVNWATDGLCLNIQGGSFNFFPLKTSPSRSEFAVSSNSPWSWQRSRVFLKFTSAQGRLVGSQELGSKRGSPWLQDDLLHLQPSCVQAEEKNLPSHK